MQILLLIENTGYTDSVIDRKYRVLYVSWKKSSLFEKKNQNKVFRSTAKVEFQVLIQCR